MSSKLTLIRNIASLALFVCFKMSLAQHAQAPNQEANATLAKSDRQFFIENKGQWSDEVLYLTRMGGMDVWITKQGVNYTFYKIEKDPNTPKREVEHLPKAKFECEHEDYILLGHRVIADYVGANANPTPEGKQKQQGYYNYLIGNDPSKHASNVGLYKEAVVKNVYNGIDIRYYFDRGSLRYDYIVHPRSNPAQIKLKLRGQYDAYLKGKDLAYTTRFGQVQLSDLHTYQQGKTIASRFVKQDDVWQIAVGKYDKTQTLIIDPLVYSTYIGGSGSDEGFSISIDSSGNAYVTGITGSINYDVTSGAFQTTHGGGSRDVFVTKLNTIGTGLVYSTYIGGSSDEIGNGIAVDGSGNVYVAGWTWSTNYPVTPGAFQTTFGGISDVFVTKLNTIGTGLVYSTYIGGGLVIMAMI